ncbi:MAG TPA: DUF2071 domain-containing protein [Acidisarcina sp.]|nr:DUF2071 domain-containing protein [Acidisarcina sp.]
MSQRWNDLLFAHWPVPPEQLAPLIPPQLVVDTYDGEAWVGVVPFWIDRIELRGMPQVPGIDHFPELNLRTYVRERDTNSYGVFFFSLDAANALAVAMARALFHLPYYWARIKIEPQEDRSFLYKSERLLSPHPVRFQARYRGLGPTLPQSCPGTIEYFLTERYCLYTTNRHGELLRGNIHHSTWLLEKAEAEIRINDLPAAHGIRLPDTAPLLHYSREMAVYIWTLELAYAMAAGARAPLSAAEPL